MHYTYAMTRPLPLLILSALLCIGCVTVQPPPKAERPKVTPQLSPKRPQVAPAHSTRVTEVSADAEATPSGLRHLRLRPGTGQAHPGPESTVTVNYIGWTDEGKVLDSSYTRGEPATFKLTKVIKGWQEGVPLMVVGEKRRFWIPGKLAYADSPMTHVPKGMLTFDIELLSFEP